MQNRIAGMITALLVAPLRACFYRHASLLSGPLQPTSALSLIVLVICLLALAATRPHTHAIINNAWWAVVPPGVAVVIVVVACTMVGQAMEDAFNPRLRSGHLSVHRFRLRRVPSKELS